MNTPPKNSCIEHQAAPTNDPAADYMLWQQLRPYIGHCLTLNHEVNNALTSLLGYIDLMLVDRSSLTADQIDHLENIQTAALRIKAAAEQLSSEKITLSEEIDLRSVIEAYTRTARPSK